MIEGVKIKKLRIIPDERGRLIEILRNDDDMFKNFGQTYITTNYPGVVKAWHKHIKQTDTVCCISGMIKLVLFDGRENSKTFGEVTELFIGKDNMLLVQIPENIYHGWKCISQTESIVINIPDLPYCYDNPDEIRLPYNSDKIPYDWEIIMK